MMGGRTSEDPDPGGPKTLVFILEKGRSESGETGSGSAQHGEPLAYGHPVRVEAGELLQAELPVLGLVEHGRPHGPSRLPRQKDLFQVAILI